METSFVNIIHKIFSDEPKPKDSINLLLSESDNEYVFQTLLNIFIAGSNIVKDRIIINNYNLHPDHPLINTMKKYFNSIGIILTISDFNEIDFIKSYCKVVVKNNLCFLEKVHVNPIFMEKDLDLNNYMCILEQNNNDSITKCTIYFQYM